MITIIVKNISGSYMIKDIVKKILTDNALIYVILQLVLFLVQCVLHYPMTAN